MNAETKSAVPIDLAINQYFVGIIEGFRIAICRREAKEDPVVLLHGATLELEIILDESSHRDRRVSPKKFLYRRRQQLGMGDETFEIIGVIGEMPDR